MIYLYILKSSKDGSYYIGQTKNIKDRLYKHNFAQSVSTKSKLPWQIVYVEKYKNRAEAVRREKQIKKEKSSTYIKRLAERGVAQLG